jgi:hypothetical protein
MQREALLIDYVVSQLELSRYLLNVILTNYGAGYAKWSSWACSLAALQHRMEEHSQYLSSMVQLLGAGMPEAQMSSLPSLSQQSNGSSGNSSDT